MADDRHRGGGGSRRGGRRRRAGVAGRPGARSAPGGITAAGGSTRAGHPGAAGARARAGADALGAAAALGGRADAAHRDGAGAGADRPADAGAHTDPAAGARAAAGRLGPPVAARAAAGLPNGTTGWVPRRALGAYELETQRLIVNLRRRRARLVRGRRTLLRAPIGVGKRRWPTPRGHFIVRNRLVRYSSPEYGPIAFGTDARSTTLTDWPAGGFIGIHGTNRPDLLPGRVSHGCIRMRNADILRLARLMPVGTPVTVL